MNPLIAPILAILGKLIPDPSARAQAELELLKMQQQGQLAELDAVVKTLTADMTGNWLQRSWRPILMLTFGGLIVARWFGFSAPGLSEPEYLKLWDIVQLGIGGYVMGRSGEKIATAVATAIKK